MNNVAFRILDKSVTSADGFQLPTIGKPTDFKGFLDTSIVFQKLRKQMQSQGGAHMTYEQEFDMGSATATAGGRRTGGFVKRGGPVKAIGDVNANDEEEKKKVQPKGTRF